MSTPILDFADDGGALMRRIYPSLDDIPDFVKTAELVDASSAPNLDDGHFALVVNLPDGGKLRKFATIDLGNAFISALYLNTFGDSLPEDMYKEAAANLEHAFEAYGVQIPDVLKHKAMEKTSSAYTDGGFIPAFKEEITIADAIRASEDFDMFYSNIEPEQRRPLAQDLVKMAATVGLNPSERAGELAGERVSPYAATVVRARIECTTDPIACVTYEKLASILEADPDSDPDEAINLLYAMDKRAGLTHRYGTFIPEPATAIMKGANIGGMEDTPPGVIYRDVDTGNALTSDRYNDMLAGGELDDMLEDDIVRDLIAAGEGGFDILPITLKTAIGRRA